MPGLRERRALLAVHSVPHVGQVALQRILAELGARDGLARLFDLSAEELTRRFRLRRAAVEAIGERGERIAADAAALERELRERDVHWLVATEPEYSRRLARAPWSPPPVLFTRGNEDLLDHPAIAFLNSADAPARALDLTDALADRVAAQGVAVVSGHNTPGYKAAAVAAVRHGAPRLLVLDRGLISAPEDAFDREPVAPARVWCPEWDDLAGLAVSPFRPQDGWGRANGRRRDELVAGLATGLVAVHVRAGGVMEGIARTALAGGMWLGVWEGGEGAGSDALLAERRPNLRRLAASLGIEETARQLVEAVTRESGEERPRGREAKRWAERERQLLYSLLERAVGGVLDVDRLLDFGDLDRWPPAAAQAPGVAGAAVRDATGVREPRPALEVALSALGEGGWLAALVDARALAGEEGAAARQWLAGQGWVAATVALPAREIGAPTAALLFRKGTSPQRPVLTVTPETPVGDAAAHRQYLTQARARVQAHLAAG